MKLYSAKTLRFFRIFVCFSNPREPGRIHAYSTQHFITPTWWCVCVCVCGCMHHSKVSNITENRVSKEGRNIAKKRCTKLVIKYGTKYTDTKAHGISICILN